VRRSIVWLGTAVALTTVGCASTGDLDRVTSRVTALESASAEHERRIQALEAEMANATASAERSARSAAEAAARADEAARKADAIFRKSVSK